MGTTGTPTTYAHLSQWVLSDKPGMEDFNEDNKKIDSKLYDMCAQLEQMEQTLESKQDKDRQTTLECHVLEGADTAIYPEGIGGYFEKDEKGYVYLYINGDSPNGGAGQLGVLPEGCRPYHGIKTACQFISGQYGIEVGLLSIAPDGRVTCYLQEPRPEPHTTYHFHHINGSLLFPTRRDG